MAACDVEGAEPLQPDEHESVAIAVFNTLKTGQGGLDWSGLPMCLELFGVDDVAADAGTIGYEILTGLGRRFARVHLPA